MFSLSSDAYHTLTSVCSFNNKNKHFVKNWSKMCNISGNSGKDASS